MPGGSRRHSMTIEVVKPGFATTVQDLGRPGYYHLGIPLSGAMDRYAHRAANLLVGNDEGDAGLEAVFIGPELRLPRRRRRRGPRPRPAAEGRGGAVPDLDRVPGAGRTDTVVRCA